MSVNVRLPKGDGPARVAGAIDRLARWLARHWLATFNIFVAIFIGLPFLAPVLAHVGAAGPARLIYAIYAPTCHQLPERSFWLFGPQAVYTVPELESDGAPLTGLNILQRQALRFDGLPETGYKVAICQRDIAIYGGILLSGMLFGLLRSRLPRSRHKLPKMPIWLFGLLLVPMFLDGATQLVGWRESFWTLRLVTGGLFGSAVVWLAYPYVQEAMEDILFNDGPQTGQKPLSAV